MYLFTVAVENPAAWIQDQNKIVDALLEKAKKVFNKKDYAEEYYRIYINNLSMFVLHELFPQGNFDTDPVVLNTKDGVTDLVRITVEYVRNKEDSNKTKRYLLDGGFQFEDVIENE